MGIGFYQSLSQHIGIGVEVIGGDFQTSGLECMAHTGTAREQIDHLPYWFDGPDLFHGLSNPGDQGPLGTKVFDHCWIPLVWGMRSPATRQLPQSLMDTLPVYRLVDFASNNVVEMAAHLRLGIEDGFDMRQHLAAQINPGPTQVFGHLLRTASPGDGAAYSLLTQNPGQGQLGAGQTQVVGHLPEGQYLLPIGLGNIAIGRLGNPLKPAAGWN